MWEELESQHFCSEFGEIATDFFSEKDHLPRSEREIPFLLFIPKASVNYSGVTAALATQVKKQVKSRWLSLFSMPPLILKSLIS